MTERLKNWLMIAAVVVALIILGLILYPWSMKV